MPRLTVYVPDDLKARMDTAGGDLNWSAITQRAIQEAIVSQSLERNPTDMSTVIERLRASKQKANETNEANGRECGAHWAKTEAEYEELERIWSAVSDGSEIDTRSFSHLIDPEEEMDGNDWEGFWRRIGQTSPSDAFLRGFTKSAADVFAEVKDRL